MHSRLDGYSLQLLGREQSFEWTPKWEGLNPERLALGHSTEQSLNKRQKAGKRGKKRNERYRTGGETRAGEERWLGGEGDLPFSGTIRRQILVFLF